MTKRKRKINTTIISLMSIGFLYLGCIKQARNYSVEFPFQKIEREVLDIINGSENKQINLSTLTPFEWDTLYVFKPYTPIKKINRELGFEWNEFKNTNGYNDDNYNLLIFTYNREVVKYLKWPRDKGDFIKTDKFKYSQNEVTFAPNKEDFGDQKWVFLYHLPNDSLHR